MKRKIMTILTMLFFTLLHLNILFVLGIYEPVRNIITQLAQEAVDPHTVAYNIASACFFLPIGLYLVGRTLCMWRRWLIKTHEELEAFAVDIDININTEK